MVATTTSSTWQQPACTLNQPNLRALIAGDVPAILIASFATSDECHALCQAIRNRGDQAEEAKTTRMNLIGANFSNYAGETKTVISIWSALHMTHCAPSSPTPASTRWNG
ncbi:MAG: hypothetical protein ACR2QJ_11620 [Geminicoccaceae bacterium]